MGAGPRGSRATATPPWWEPEDWPVPRSVPSSAASAAPSPCIPRRRTPWLRRPHRTRPLAAAANQANEAVVDGGTARSAETAASFSSLAGPLTQGIAPLHWLTAGTGSPPLPPLAATLADVAGGTSASGGGAGGGGSELVPDRVRPARPRRPTPAWAASSAASPRPWAPSARCLTDPTRRGRHGLDPSLTGVITDVTGTLANLSSLLPIASLPLPPGGVSAGGIPGLGALLATGLPNSSGATSLLSTTGLASGAGEISSLLGGVTGGGGGRHRVGGTLAAPTSPRQWRRREWRLDHRRDHRAWSARNLDERHDSDSPTKSVTSTPTSGTTSSTTSTTSTPTTSIDQHDARPRVGDGAAAGPAAAGEHPARLGGRRLRRCQHEPARAPA